uniref:Uncharacterized protein n=1 Tax=Plectus sambesii TaxID=2011161 RepID=A0A914UUW7_9BILA
MENGVMTGRLSVVQLGMAPNTTDNEYMAVFRPFIWLSSASGVGARSRLGNVYSLCTLLLIIFCMLRGCSFLDLDGFRPALVFKVLLLLYSAHTFVSYLFINNIKHHSLPMFLARWREVQRDSHNIANIAKLKMAAKVGISYVIGVAIVNGIFVGCGSIEFLIKFPFIQSYLFLPELSIANGVIVFFTSFTFALSQVLYMTFCLVLMSEYHHYDQEFLQLQLHQLSDRLPLLRRQHRKITKLTGRKLTWFAIV